MAVYILKYSEPGFNGIMGGVDFFNGQGSTSSLRDARVLQERGCSIFDMEGHPVEVEKSKHAESHSDVFAVKAAVVSSGAGVDPKVETKHDGGEVEAKAEASPVVSIVLPSPVKHPVKRTAKKKG